VIGYVQVFQKSRTTGRYESVARNSYRDPKEPETFRFSREDSSVEFGETAYIGVGYYAKVNGITSNKWVSSDKCDSSKRY